MQNWIASSDKQVHKTPQMTMMVAKGISRRSHLQQEVTLGVPRKQNYNKIIFKKLNKDATLITCLSLVKENKNKVMTAKLYTFSYIIDEHI